MWSWRFPLTYQKTTHVLRVQDSILLNHHASCCLTEKLEETSRQRNRYDYSINTSTEQTNLYHHSNISQLFVTEISGQPSAVGNPATDGQRVQGTQPVALWQLSFAKATVENSTPTAHLTENPENRETPQEKDSRVLFTRQKSVYSTLHGILGFVSPPGIKLGSGKHSDPLGRVSVGPEESVFV